MLVVGGPRITIADIAAVAGRIKVQLSRDEKVIERVHRSRRIVQDAVSNGQQVYGVTTLFGGCATAFRTNCSPPCKRSRFGSTKAQPGHACRPRMCEPRCCCAPIH